jgi:hypothetical protein
LDPDFALRLTSEDSENEFPANTSKEKVRRRLTDTANLKQCFSSGARIMTMLQATVRGRDKRSFGPPNRSDPVHLVPMALSPAERSPSLKLTTDQHLKPKSKTGRSITPFNRVLAGTVPCIM